MSESFDPYYKWLGIPPKDQPPHHYRLLGLELFEKDPEVIEAAANRQMIYVQGCATGPYVAASQKLLNEIAQARLALLDATRKAAYDRQLRTSTKPPGEPPSPASTGETFAAPRRTVDTRVVGPTGRGGSGSPAAGSSSLPMGAPVVRSAPNLVIPHVGPTLPAISLDVPTLRPSAPTRTARGRKRVRIDAQFGIFVAVAIVLVIVGAVVAPYVRTALLEKPGAKQPAGNSTRPER